MFDGKIFAYFYVNCLCVRFVTLFPKNKIWSDLELLRNFRFQSEHCFLIWRLVRFDRDGFYLSASTISDVKRGGNLAFVSRRYYVLLGLRSGATAGGGYRLEVHRCLAGVLGFEVPDRLLIGRSGVQLDRGLLPFQFGARAQAHDHRQGESEAWCFHFLE